MTDRRPVFLSLILVLMLMFAVLTTGALASGAPVATELDIKDGSITIGDGTYTQSSGTEGISEGGLVITGESDINTITVDPGEGKTAAFTIENLTLTTESGKSLIDVRSGSAEISLSGTNTLTGGGKGITDGALIRVSGEQKLIIKGEGSLTLNNGTKSKAAHGAAIGGSVSEDGGTINIESGNITIVQYGPGAGIGGGGPNAETSGTGDSGDITISGGVVNISVTAVDNYGGGCGIGPGMNYFTSSPSPSEGALDSITISGGIVEVTTKSIKLDYEHFAGAAIGNGRVASSNGTIIITGSANVKALADVSAAIGGSSAPITHGVVPSGNGGAVIIDGNAVVYAETTLDNSFTGNYSGAAIGQGCMSWLDWEIKIGGSADVKAYAGPTGAGIGSSFGYSKAKLSIEIGASAEVIAYAGQYGAGIGTSYNSWHYTQNFTTISISGNADVTAVGGPYTGGAGIGSGYGDHSGNITITDEARVTAAVGPGASAIGAGASGMVAGTTTITAGTYVEAYADGTKFAIDISKTSTGAVNVSDTVLNGRFATDANPPVDDDDEPSTIYLLKDGKIDSTLTLPDNYRSFAVTASDGKGVIKVQNAANESQYAYYLDDNDAKQIVYPLYDTLDDENYEMLTKDNLRWASFITITPADITIYIGGMGYAGAVDEFGELIGDGSGFPEPGFVVSVPDEIEDIGTLRLVYENGDTKYLWKLEAYGKGEHNVYRIVPADDATPPMHVKMQFTTEDGTVVETDNFDFDKYLNQTLHMKVYGEGIDEAKVRFSYEENTYQIAVEAAELTVRATTDNALYAGVSEMEIEAGAPQLKASDDTTYYINDTPVEIADTSGIALLFDDIIETDENDTNKGLLRDRAVKTLGEGKWEFEYKYLDLVDTENGNAWVSANKTVTVYWPRPENAPENAEFTLLHFNGLHREMGTHEIAANVAGCTVTEVELTLSEDGEYLCFEVDSTGFSPFVLAWSAPDDPDHPYIPPVTPTEPSEPDYTPNWLNTTDHFGYIIGYEDGTVKPNAGITRAEVATIFFRLLTDEARERFWSETNAYTDVADGSWYNNAISTLSNIGILGGYEDGTFRPNASITRAEFAKIAVSFFDWADIEAANNFVDVRDSAWYANYVAVAAKIGLIEGYGGNVFRPDATITRAEACTIINRTLGRAPDADHLLPVSQMNTWPDNSDTGVWYYAQIQEATNSHDYRWLGDIEQWTAKLPEPDWDKLQY